MQIKDPKPEIMRLEELAISVKSGEIKLPRFQRPFVWKKTDMLKLLDSIYKGYPIGSLLLWNSSQKLKSERSLFGLEVNIDEKMYFPTNYLLDGQQRLTTLCGALFWNGTDQNSIWNIQFDLDTETFLHPVDPNLVNLFPLNRIIQTSDFIRQCMKFDHHAKKDTYFRNAERLLKALKDYKIAVVKIGDMTMDEVAPIFERINSTGRKLTIVDLMMAATFSDEFDLASEIAAIQSDCKAAGFDEVSDAIILRSISASAGLGINKDDIQKLRLKNATELVTATQLARKCILKAFTFLRDQIGIKDFSYVPYGFQFTYLAEFFRINPEPTQQKINHLISWFWFTSSTKYFGTTNTGLLSKDLAEIRSFALGTRSGLFEQSEIDISKLLFEKFNLRNASSTTFTLLLNNLNPTKTLDNLTIDGSHLKLKSNRFFESYCPANSELAYLNMSRIIYPYTMSTNGLSRLSNPADIDSHLLNAECIRLVQEGDDAGYMRERANLIAQLVSRLTGCSTIFHIPNTLFDNNEEYFDPILDESDTN